MKTFESNSAEETMEIGKLIASETKSGDVYALIGDLGVGKTAFSQGFAKGLGIKSPVASPTFTILMEYDEGRIPLHHFDVYRIADPMELEEIGFDDCIYSDGATLIEWADLIREELPQNTTYVRIEKDLEKGFDYRKITIE